MADYYSILDKTISRLPENTTANRSLVFAKAREAIERQLRGLTPLPGEDAIARQMLSLENAISKIEVEQSFDADMDSVAEAVTASVSGLEETVEPAIETPSAVVSPDGGNEPQPVTLQTPPRTEEQDFIADTPKERGMVGRMLPYLVGLVVVGGGAYGLWLNKDALLDATRPAMEMAAPVSDNAPSPTENSDILAPVTLETAEVDSSDKESARLGGNGETVAPEPIVVEPVSQPNGDDTTEPLVLQPAPDPSVEPAPLTEKPVEVTEVGKTGDEPATPVATGLPVIAQKAYLYEEGGANGAASRSDAAIVWTLNQEAPSPGQPAEAVVKGRLDIPGNQLSMVMTIKRNTDEGLPASHIIELNFEGGEIDNVARFVMKASEQARGEGLVAVPAKIDTGYFLIALNNLPQAIETNSKLLLESDWIDIPLGYATGRRALVTLEKGVIGERVFREAFDDWKNR